MIRLLILFFLISSISTNSLMAQSLELEKTAVAENRVNVNLSDFLLIHQNNFVKLHFVESSVKWIRNEANLLVPRALLAISFSEGVDHNKLIISHNNRPFFPTRSSLKDSHIEIYLDLFNPGSLQIFEGDKKIDEIIIQASSTTANRDKQLIDYSCSPYQIKIVGIDDEYLSIGCKLEKFGELGSEKPRLEITISSTNLVALNGARPPFKAFLNNHDPVELHLKNQAGLSKNISISAVLPERIYRLNTALGLGPYMYSASNEIFAHSNKPATSFMIYGKFDLTTSSSLKFFNSATYARTLFNNAGLYFSYDLAEILDGRILLNTLLGFQGLHFKFNSESKTHFDVIYPQGFELTYRHAFNQENYHLTYGLFISRGSYDYTNTWLRYGKKVFYEINYISWHRQENDYKTWGLSIGFPFWKGL